MCGLQKNWKKDQCCNPIKNSNTPGYYVHIILHQLLYITILQNLYAENIYFRWQFYIYILNCVNILHKFILQTNNPHNLVYIILSMDQVLTYLSCPKFMAKLLYKTLYVLPSHYSYRFARTSFFSTIIIVIVIIIVIHNF